MVAGPASTARWAKKEPDAITSASSHASTNRAYTENGQVCSVCRLARPAVLRARWERGRRLATTDKHRQQGGHSRRNYSAAKASG